MSESTQSMTRRSFVSAGAAAVAAAGLAGTAASALADEAAETEEAASDVPAWLGTAPEIAEDQISEVVDTEVLVCGAGTSGLFAACAAAEAGAKVVCLEKYSIGGGVRDNLGSLNSRLQKEAGCEIDENEIVNDMIRYADNYCNPRLYHLWAQNSGEAIDWYQDRLEEAGFELYYEGAANAKETFYKHWPTVTSPAGRPTPSSPA